MGIIFPNMHDEAIGELTVLRTTASVPFGGRYRLIDFTLSAMVAADIDNVAMVVKRNYVSLMDHVGSGKEWDLSRKIGGLKIFPPYAEAGTHAYKGKIEALNGILTYMENSLCDTVILADCGIVSAIDYKDVLEKHARTGADITVVYKKEIIDRCSVNDNVTFEMDENEKIEGVYINEASDKPANSSMWSYVIGKKLLIEIVRSCYKRGLKNFEEDVLQGGLSWLKVYGYEYKGFMRRISSLKCYFDANLDLIDKKNLDCLFSNHPVYTKIRDDAPVRYGIGSKVNKIIAGDGCYIEGDVENSVLFRGVKIGKNTSIKNCILMQDTVVADNVILENVICDKNVVISEGKKLIGDISHPVFVEKRAQV